MSDTVAVLPEIGESPIPRLVGEMADRLQTLETQATDLRLQADELEEEASRIKAAVKAMSR